MKIKLFFLGLMSILAVSAQDEDPRSMIKAALKAPSPKYNIYGDVYLGSRLDTDALELEDLSDLPAYLDNLTTHDDYRKFMTGAKQFDELDPATSDELRYHMLISWAEENGHPTWDNDSFFPLLSSTAIEHVYLPLGRLLLNGFRADDQSRSILIDLCLTSLNNYIDMMIHDFNPYTKKDFRRQYIQNRFSYIQKLLVKVCDVAELIPTIRRTEKPQKLQFFNDTNTQDGPTNGVRRIALNSDFRDQSEKNRTIENFCCDQYKSLSKKKKCPSPKEALTELYSRYSILYDFLFTRDVGRDLYNPFAYHSREAAMLRYKPAFDKAWAKIENVEDLNQEELAEHLYPKILKIDIKLNPRLPRSQTNYSLSVIFRDIPIITPPKDLYSPMPEDDTGDDTPHIMTVDLQPRDAFSPRTALPIPVISVNGQPIDSDQ